MQLCVDPLDRDHAALVGTKLAYTLVGAETVKVQVSAVPHPGIDHPPTVHPVPGAAVRVTLVPAAKVEEHTGVVQLNPAGLDVIVPVPCSWSCTDGLPNDAETVVATVSGIVQVADVPHGADHPVNTLPAPGVAVRVTLVPNGNAAAQVAPQLMPAGEDTTVPDVAVLLTVKVGVVVKLAVTLVAADIVTVQVSEVPLHPPLQPANAEPLAGTAVSVTLDPADNSALQVDGQPIPAGAE